MALEFNLNLKESELRELAGEAILKALDQTSRDTLLKNAIEHLLTKEKSSYGSGRSPIERIFQDALENVARKIILEDIEKDDKIKEEIKNLIAAAWEKFNDPSIKDKMATKAADAIAKTFFPERY